MLDPTALLRLGGVALAAAIAVLGTTFLGAVYGGEIARERRRGHRAVLVVAFSASLVAMYAVALMLVATAWLA